MPLSRVGSLLAYHSHVNADEAVETLNYMLEAVSMGQILFFDIYTDAQKQADPSKENTGLFFFKGEPDRPFAVVSAGGGFSYVGSIHESFPHAIALSEKL